MIKQVVFSRLKEYGKSLLESHGKIDIETLHVVAQGKINSMDGKISKIVLSELLNSTKKYVDRSLNINQEKQDSKKQEKEVIDANFKVKKGAYGEN